LRSAQKSREPVRSITWLDLPVAGVVGGLGQVPRAELGIEVTQVVGGGHRGLLGVEALVEPAVHPEAGRDGAVGAMNCQSPLAPAWETATGLKPLSIITVNTRSSGSPFLPEDVEDHRQIASGACEPALHDGAAIAGLESIEEEPDVLVHVHAICRQGLGRRQDHHAPLQRGRRGEAGGLDGGGGWCLGRLAERLGPRGFRVLGRVSGRVGRPGRQDWPLHLEGGGIHGHGDRSGLDLSPGAAPARARQPVRRMAMPVRTVCVDVPCVVNMNRMDSKAQATRNYMFILVFLADRATGTPSLGT